MSERPARYHLPGMATLPAQRQARGGARPYRRGSRAERQLQAELERDGALVLRSTGSRGPWDLAVIAERGGCLVQCKLTTQPPTAGQLRRWLDALPAVPVGWRARLAVCVGGAWRWYDRAAEGSAQ